MKEFPVLYARTATGATQTWQIFTEEDSFWTVSGQIDGLKVTSEKTVCAGKNQGKKNETSGAEQAEKEAAAKFKKKLESGYYEDISSIDVAKFFEPMLSHKFEDYKEDIDWQKGVYISPKLDGLRCVITKGGAFSRNGKPFVTIPHILKKLEPQFKLNPNLVIDSEIYSHKFKNDFNKIISLAKKSKPEPEDLSECEKHLQIWIFDMPSVSGGYGERYLALKEFVFSNYFNDPHIIVCKHELIHSESELKEIFNKYIIEGFEGVMINTPDGEYQNKRSKNVLKYKEFQDEEFEILNIIEGDGNRAGMFGRAKLKMEGGKTFESNARGNEEFYRDLLKNKDRYVGKMATVRFQNLTPDGIPRFPVIVSIRDYE